MNKRFSSKPGKNIGSFFDKWDFFASPVPSFNMEGEEQVGTSIGCLFSILATITIIFYASVRGQICISKGRPSISSIIIENNYSKDYKVDLACPSHDL
jgi:hypothetical protein